MSDVSDSSLPRTLSQANKTENGGIRDSAGVASQDALYLAQLRYFTAFAAIGEHILAFITGEFFLVLAARMKHLARAAFIPSFCGGNVSALAFWLNMTEKGASDLARRRHMPFSKPGDERIFTISDVAKNFEAPDKPQDSVAHAKRKRIRKPKA